jgi:hypothetical protein
MGHPHGDDSRRAAVCEQERRLDEWLIAGRWHSFHGGDFSGFGRSHLNDGAIGSEVPVLAVCSRLPLVDPDFHS